MMGTPVPEVLECFMAAGVSVRCPVCRGVGTYVPPALPCACGTRVVVPLLDGAEGVVIERRTWAEDWIAVRCGACTRTGHWPHPEFGCACGALLRLAVVRDEDGGGPVAPGQDGGGPVVARTAFRAVPIRSARDAVTVAALYLGWLGYGAIRRAAEPPPAGIALAAQGLLAHVEPTTRPVTVRDVECLWLAGLAAGVRPVGFTRGGPDEAAARSAERLGVPLFVLPESGRPEAGNGPARRLAQSGAEGTG